jgi:hypothetical protein
MTDWAFPGLRNGLPSTKADVAPVTTYIGDGRGRNYQGPDGRIYWAGNREEQHMDSVCKECRAQQHQACDQRGRNSVVCQCLCETATRQRRMVRDVPGVNEALDPDRGSNDVDYTPLAEEAIEVAHVEYEIHKPKVCIPVEVLQALIGKAKAWETHNTTPMIIKADTETLDKLGRFTPENGDPMYQRAKRALAEIGTYLDVEVKHEQDTHEVRDAAGSVRQRYGTGSIEATITIRGYVR